MTGIVLQAKPLTPERFLPYGEVIEASKVQGSGMNDARFDRFDDLCGIDIVDGKVSVSIVLSRTASLLPYRIDMVERHPLGSQAFVPLSPCRMFVVVGPPAESIDPTDLRAFETNGKQGINYRRGTWHMPLIALDSGQQFLVIDRAGEGVNCDQHVLDEPVMLQDSEAR
jgi:ureidoglycolate lyase